MSVTIVETDGLTRAKLSGRLDTALVNQVELPFTAGIVPKGKDTLVDLSDVSFIASLGLGLLLTVARTLGRSGVQFVIYGAPPAVMDIFETSAISEIIPVYATEAEALAAVRK